jgi:hypothetical protein
MSARWTIKQNSLPFFTEDDETKWPNTSQAELNAWSAFCARIEFSLPIVDKIEVKKGTLTPDQLAQAIQIILSRGWSVVESENTIEIAKPKIRIRSFL